MQDSVNAQSSAGIIIFKEFTTGFPTPLWCGQLLEKSQLYQNTFLSGKSSRKVLDLVPTRCPKQVAFSEKNLKKEKELSLQSFH